MHARLRACNACRSVYNCISRMGCEMPSHNRCGTGLATARGAFTLATICVIASNKTCFSGSAVADGFGESHELCDAATSGGKLGADTSGSLDVRLACTWLALASSGDKDASVVAK